MTIPFIPLLTTHNDISVMGGTSLAKVIMVTMTDARRCTAWNFPCYFHILCYLAVAQNMNITWEIGGSKDEHVISCNSIKVSEAACYRSTGPKAVSAKLRTITMGAGRVSCLHGINQDLKYNTKMPQKFSSTCTCLELLI